MATSTELVPAVPTSTDLERYDNKALHELCEALGEAADVAKAERKHRMEALYADGMKQRAIAAEFGCNQSTVQRILSGKTGNEARDASTHQLSDKPTVTELRDAKARLRAEIKRLDGLEDQALDRSQKQWAKDNARPEPAAPGANEAEPVEAEVVDGEPVIEPTTPTYDGPPARTEAEADRPKRGAVTPTLDAMVGDVKSILANAKVDKVDDRGLAAAACLRLITAASELREALANS